MIKDDSNDIYQKENVKDEDIIIVNNESIFNPFNPLNNEICKNDVIGILNNYGVNYRIDNIVLYQRAFVHKSYTKRPHLENVASDIKIAEKPYNCLDLKSKSNERLEFIGDGVLELITKYYLYRRFPKADEGFMTEKKIALVKNEHIGKLAYEMRLHKWLLLSRHAEEKNTRVNLKKLGCLFESFLGALFLDVNKLSIKDEENWFQNVFVTGPGFQMAQKFVENIFEKHVDWTELIKNDYNYKNKFQVLIQKEFKTTPEYVELEHDIENGYEMGVYLCLGQELHEFKISESKDFNYFGTFEAIQNYLKDNDKLLVFFGKAKHKIKKKAEQVACEQIIKNIKI
jgi:dsRNA-specific ribonuclease